MQTDQADKSNASASHIVRGAAWTLVDQAIVSGGTFLTTVLVARFAGVEEFGFYSVAILLILLFQNLQSAAIVTPMMVIRPRITGVRVGGYDRALIEQSAAYSFTVSSLSLFTLLAVTSIGGIKVGIGAAPFSAAVAVSIFQDFQRRYAFARSDPIHATICDALRYVIFALCLLSTRYIFSSNVSSSDALWLLTLSTMPSLLYSLLYTGLLAVRSRMRRYAVRRHFYFSAWTVGQTMLQYITTNTQFFFVGGAVSTAAVGGLRAAMNLANLVNVILLALENWVPVRMAQLAVSEGTIGVNGLIRNTIILAVVMFVPLVLGSAHWGEFAMRLLYGRSYAGFGSLVFWWMCVNFVSALAIPLRSALRTTQRPKSVFFAQMIACIVAVLSTPLAISSIGLAGGPIVLFASLSLFVALSGYEYARVVR